MLSAMTVTDINRMSVTDNPEGGAVTKGEDDLRVRLQRAALDLFRERGYDRTTAAQIAARAGVTERTFFRQFPDKREVLFDGEAILRAALTAAVADGPDGPGPLDLLFHAFRSVVPLLEVNRPYAKPRHEVISATPALHERELAKLEVLTEALADALRERGVADLRAVLTAHTGMAAFAHATISWLANPEPGLGERLDLVLSELKAILAASEA